MRSVGKLRRLVATKKAKLESIAREGTMLFPKNKLTTKKLNQPNNKTQHLLLSISQQELGYEVNSMLLQHDFLKTYQSQNQHLFLVLRYDFLKSTEI